MMRKFAGSIGAFTLLWAAALVAGGCTPTDRDFASGGAGGQGGCPTGFAECDGNPDTVCETDTASSSDHCGMCGNPCAAAVDANIGCVAGTCSITSCNNDRGNCDNFYDNGCETNPTTSFEHCGTCGNSCEAPNAITACVAGGCQLAQCVMGQLDCDMDPQTGCEVDPATNVDHCGACGMACTSPNATMACMDSMCSFVECNPNFADCNKFLTDGCETDLLSDPYHCNACGNSCNGGACNAGVCNPPILVAKMGFPPGKIAVYKSAVYVGSRSTNGDIASVPTGGGNPTQINLGPGAVNDLAVSNDGIFVAGSKGSMRVNLDGSGKFTYDTILSRGITLTSNEVYWSVSNTIRKSGFILPNGTTVYSAPTTIYDVFIDGNDSLYWTHSDGSIWSSLLVNFSPKQISMGPTLANNIIVDLNDMYWSSSKGVHTAPTSGGDPVNLVTASAIGSVAIDPTYVYWTEESKGLVRRIVRDGSASPEVLALDQSAPYGLALDAQFVYWSDSNTGEIWKLAK